MSSEVIKVTTKGQATIPKELRDEFGITTPGRVVMDATEDGILIEPVPTPEEVAGELRELAAERDRSGVEILREGRKADAAQDEQLQSDE